MLIGVNLSSNAYPTGILPHPNPPLSKATVYTQVLSVRVSSFLERINCDYESSIKGTAVLCPYERCGFFELSMFGISCECLIRFHENLDTDKFLVGARHCRALTTDVCTP